MPRFTLANLNPKYHAEVERQLSQTTPENLAGLRSPQPEQDAQYALSGEDGGKEEGNKRITVCITRASTRLLDKDNLYGSAKWICDGLRYLGLIPDDDPESIDLIVKQVKVQKEKVGTLIEIT